MSDQIYQPVLQDWVCRLPFMQQSVLIAAMRGPDGVEKSHKSKALCKWLRRCIVISAFDKRALDNPYDKGGGSYTGPSIDINHANMGEPWEALMEAVVKQFIDSQDDVALHFYMHFLHAAEIIGYRHSNERIRNWWNKTYARMAHDLHLNVETEYRMDMRLNDDEAAWRADISRFKP